MGNFSHIKKFPLFRSTHQIYRQIKKSDVSLSFFYIKSVRLYSILPSMRYLPCSLRLSYLAAHKSAYLVLLPSDPDTVRKFLLHKTQFSTPTQKGSPYKTDTSNKHRPHYSGLWVTRHR